jgi:hypothetical protein
MAMDSKTHTAILVTLIKLLVDMTRRLKLLVDMTRRFILALGY